MKTSLGAVLATTVLLLSGCAGSSSAAEPTTFVDNVDNIGALAATEDGGLVFAERTKGDIYSVSAQGIRGTQPVAHIEVSSDGQRGLIGLAVDKNGALFAAWTQPGGPKAIQVGRIENGKVTVVWSGPASSDLANGGHIAFRPDGRLVLGIGGLRDQANISNPETLNGKLLSLDPAGPADQKPEIISAGWNNPYAFTITREGEIWVADNSPATEERLARGDAGGKPTEVQPLSRQDAPSAITESGDGSLYICTFNAQTLQRYRHEGKWKKSGKPVATDCSTGVVSLSDGRLVYAGQESLNLVVL